MNKNRALFHWLSDTNVGKQSLTFPNCPPHIQLELDADRTGASAIRSQRITAKVMARFHMDVESFPGRSTFCTFLKLR